MYVNIQNVQSRLSMRISHTLYLDHADFEPPLLGLNISISNGKMSATVYDKRDDFEFEVKFPFLDGDMLRSPSNGAACFNLFVL